MCTCGLTMATASPLSPRDRKCPIRDFSVQKGARERLLCLTEFKINPLNLLLELSVSNDY